jgi:SAM-dependent methyltransferase
MKAIFSRARKAFREFTQRKFVEFNGVVLPPPDMRYCGARFRDDSTFLSSGIAEARRLVSDFELGARTRLLEIGCGPGRLPIGILAEVGEIERYDGIDIDSRAIQWCRTYITAAHPAFVFHHVDARHQRYNPDGAPMDEGFRLPFPDRDFDLVYLHSVFANMEPNDIKFYAKEFHRVLKPGGAVFLTAFVEESVPPVTINPENYHVPSSGPLNVARYEKGFFLDLLTQSGLSLTHFAHGADLDGQSVVHLRRAT